MAKIYNDKYYTPDKVVKKVIELIKENIKDISEFDRVLEPSVGAGAFFNMLPEKTRLGYDIEPNIEDEKVFIGDYLNQDIPKMDNSLVIGNPPFDDGSGSNNLHLKFIEKSLQHSEYVVFILPINMYQKDNLKFAKLFKSYKLPEVEYSGVKLKTCINFYKKRTEPLKIKKIKDVEIVEFSKLKTTPKQEIERYKEYKYDYRFSAFGTLRLLEKTEKVKAHEFKVTFKNKKNFLPILKKYLLIRNKNSISAGSISKQQVIDLIYDTYEDLRVN